MLLVFVLVFVGYGGVALAAGWALRRFGSSRMTALCRC